MNNKVRQRIITWDDLDTNYTIYNVPSQIIGNDENNYYYSSEVTLKLTVLKELMESKQVPNEIDYNDVADIQF